ncbi:MAG: hypothetical protein KKE55_03895 [Candidatus Omnitrophica bacterium]|nr:hypothetical protein [Candidatus Omnitrophota bacterium]MBU2504752.1 hypothetical protein [Candidatus Omnitrophota bacterium]
MVSEKYHLINEPIGRPACRQAGICPRSESFCTAPSLLLPKILSDPKYKKVRLQINRYGFDICKEVVK